MKVVGFSTLYVKKLKIVIDFFKVYVKNSSIILKDSIIGLNLFKAFLSLEKKYSKLEEGIDVQDVQEF